MRRAARNGFLLFLAFVICLTAGIGGASSLPQRKRIVTAWLPEHETFLIWYAVQQGWDRQEGLEVELKRFATGKDLLQGADEWDMAACGAFSLLNAPSPQRFLVVGLGNDESLANVVMVRPGDPILKVKGFNAGYPSLLGHPADVRGRQIAYSASSSAQYLLARWLAAYGLTSRDVSARPLKTEEGIQSLADGKVDALVLWAPDFYGAEEHGLKVAATSRSVKARQPILLVARKNFAEKEPETAAAFLRVYLRAVRMMREESVANLVTSYKAFYREWAGKDMTDAEVIKDITIHPVFTLDDQLRLFDATRGRSEVQQWLDAIIRFQEGIGDEEAFVDERLRMATGFFLKKVGRPIPDYR